MGTLGFDAAALETVPPAAHPVLADIAAWGLAVSGARTDSLLAPLRERALDRSRLNTLALVLGARRLGVTEEDLRTAYASAPEWELEVRHIIRMAAPDAPAEERIAALEVAEEVLRRAKAGEDFAALAAKYSEEPGAAERGGQLEWGREGSWVEPFWAAAVALDPGELSQVVETDYGFHVIRVDERRPVPFAEADRARILRQLVSESASSAAMIEWASSAPEPLIDAAAADSAHAALATGALPMDLPLARQGEAVYRGADLAATWAGTTASEREQLLSADSEDFRRWLQQDAREAMWAAYAEALDAPPQEAVAEEVMHGWRSAAAQWNAALGLDPTMSPEEIRVASLHAVSSRGQEQRIAKQELEALRPLLREAYPLVHRGR